MDEGGLQVIEGRDATAGPRVLRPGDTCWRTARADRAAFLIAVRCC
jgi:hypothetical protein